jgi:hypothetical protein
VRDATGDATFDVNGRIGHSQANLDILGSSIARTSGRLWITLQVADLRSLKPDTSSQDQDKHLVWLVQWFSPSKTDPHGGKNLFAYWSLPAGVARPSGPAKARARNSRRPPRASRIPVSSASKTRTPEPRPARSQSPCRYGLRTPQTR